MAEIKTRPATPEYRDNWEKIFGKRRGKELASLENVEDGWKTVPDNAILFEGRYYEDVTNA